MALRLCDFGGALEKGVKYESENFYYYNNFIFYYSI